MRTRWPAIPLLALIALAVVAPAGADEAGAELTAAEKTALKKAERELLDLGKFAAKGNDVAAAQAALRLALEVAPDAEKPRQELERLEKKASRGASREAPKPDFPSKLAEKRTEAHREVALALADAALATKAAHPERYARYVGLLKRRLPLKEALVRLGLAYFAPYLRWVTTDEAALLERGGEVHEGQQLQPDAVAALDRRHASWSDPWVVADDVHEVRTTMPLRVANQILSYVGTYRAYFLERFGPLWELRPPAGKLPIVVTRTQADLRERLQALGAGAALPGGMQGAALYLFTNGKLNPCLVTYEPVDATGLKFKIERFEQLVIPLLHEVTHQLAFEYSKHDYDATRTVQHHFWAVEAIANYMCYHVLEDGQWRLTRPSTIPMGPGMIEGPFAWSQKNRASLPPLKRFMGQSHAQFMTIENYHIGATLAYFLLEGEGGKYRESFAKLLEVVHRVRDAANSFEACFPGVDLAALEREWLRFVAAIDLDD